jgi:RNA-directed DNA polymerase
VSLRPPESVRKLQRTLYAKAKEAPGYRFYALYDKVCRADVLAHAYRCCRANGGAAGVDGQMFAAIESSGRERWLEVLAEALREKTYRPAAIRRSYLDKPDGSQRPLGIPMVAAYCTFGSEG